MSMAGVLSKQISANHENYIDVTPYTTIYVVLPPLKFRLSVSVLHMFVPVSDYSSKSLIVYLVL